MVLSEGTAGTNYLQFLAVALYASYDAMMQTGDNHLGYADTVAAPHAPRRGRAGYAGRLATLRRIK